MLINNKKNNFIFYGLTPPKQSTEADKLLTVAQKQMDRVKDLDIDGLVLYDIQDESSRINAPRPFPFMSTLAPEVYAKDYLSSLDVPKIIYQSIGKFTEDSFKQWMVDYSDLLEYAVFVGAPSKDQSINFSLNNAYCTKVASDAKFMLGGVTIPERHYIKEDEHLRVAKKIERGCDFFISQCVYNINNTKDFLSDYYYYFKENDLEIKPIIFTLTPCGSKKTLEFLEWLGIDVPKWLKNELMHSHDILSRSIDACKAIAKELILFCREKNMPIGFNIESVAIRKAEIDASIELLKDVKKMLDHS